VSKNFERWNELAARCLDEQDSAKLTELASEMNLVLIQKTPRLDPPHYAAVAEHRKNQHYPSQTSPDNQPESMSRTGSSAVSLSIRSKE
jgi:hypothetical protein